MSKYLITTKDSSGNNYTVYNDDPRYLSGHLFPSAAKHFIDCPVHGKNIIRNQKRIKSARIPEKFKVYCPRCREYYLSSDFIIDDEMKNFAINSLKNIEFISSNQQTEKYFDKYMPHFKGVILDHPFNKIPNIRFSDLIYFTREEIYEIPECSIDNCEKKTDLKKSPSDFGFNLYCSKHQNHYYSSKGEREIYDFLKSIYNKEIIKRYKSKNNELDIFLPDLKIGIEFNGLYWHGDNKREKNYHQKKWSYFKKLGIKIITVWEDDWKYKKDVVKSILKNNLFLNKYKINSRECHIKLIEPTEKKTFLENNHIQGNCPSNINLGLLDGDKLVSIMTFGKTRMILGSRNDNYELLRFCSLSDHTVRGAASKLFSYFLKNYEYKKIISYANKDISNGKLYQILNFEKISESLNYWWSYNDKKYHRSNFMKHKLVKEGYDPDKTESQIMRERGYWKIYGNGNIKYEYTKREAV